MDEYLSEKEQVEQLKQWWHEYGWFLIGGMAISALGYYGWNQYQEYQQRIAEQAGDLYRTFQQAIEDDRADADTILAQLRGEYSYSPYTDHAGLLMARNYLISDPARATDELRYVMDSTADRELGLIARLRSVRVFVYREAYEEALDLLSVGDLGQFAARFNEIRGDIYVATGEIAAARAAYIEALTSPGSDGLDRNFVQMKLDDLKPPQAGDTESDGEA